MEGTIGDEEKDERRDDALRHTLCEHLLIEQQVQVARLVEFRVAQRVVLIYILKKNDKMIKFFSLSIPPGKYYI